MDRRLFLLKITLVDNLHNIAILIIKKWLSTLTEKEKRALDAYDGNQISRDSVNKKLEAIESVDQLAAWASLQKRIAQPPIKKKTSVRRLAHRIMPYAAVLIGIMAITHFLFINGDHEVPVVATTQYPRITLRINDSITKSFLYGGEYDIKNIHGKTIAYLKGNELLYINAKTTFDDPEHHELYVPYGQKFRVTLSDGTKVFCDAGTTLRYPSNFTSGNVRNIALTGQAYFDVSKRKKQPFVVHTRDMDIEVLGTQFNVSSYNEDRSTSTVLVEGSVKVSTSKAEADEIVTMTPGQKAVVNTRNKGIWLTSVNTYDHTSWISGKLVFKRTDIDRILKTLSRKYNVVIINKNEAFGKQKFTATFDVETIEQILDVFQETAVFEYTRTGNRIVIE